MKEAGKYGELTADCVGCARMGFEGKALSFQRVRLKPNAVKDSLGVRFTASSRWLARAKGPVHTSLGRKA